MQRAKEATMSAKKIALVGAGGILLASASAAFADHARWGHGQRGYAKPVRQAVIVRHVPRHVVPRVYVRGPLVVARPVVYQPTYYAPPVYPAVYYAGPGLATVGGAVAGALIGNQIGYGEARFASTAIGAALGAFVGSQLEYGY